MVSLGGYKRAPGSLVPLFFQVVKSRPLLNTPIRRSMYVCDFNEQHQDLWPSTHTQYSESYQNQPSNPKMLTKYTLLAALASLSSCAFAAPLIGIDNAHPAPLEARYTPSGLWNGFYVKIQDGRRFRRPASDGNDWLTRAVDSRFVSVNEKGEFAERSFEVDSDENGLFKVSLDWTLLAWRASSGGVAVQPLNVQEDSLLWD